MTFRSLARREQGAGRSCWLFFLDSIWRFRRGWIAALFISLPLTASTERRLAELHVTAVGTVLFENGEEPEGDQIASGTDPLRPRLHPTPSVCVPIPALRQ